MGAPRICCVRCRRELGATALHLHWRSCSKLPPPWELAQALDENENLTPVDLARRYGVDDDTVRKQLRGTNWTRKALATRGHRQSNLRRVGRRRTKARRCRRCKILIPPDDDDLCPDCAYERAEILKRLLIWGMKAALGIEAIRPPYRLNRIDTEWVRGLQPCLS